MGCFFATPPDFLSQDVRGIRYTEQYKNAKRSCHVAVSAFLANDMPTLQPLLRAIAQAPGSCFNVYGSERQFCKFFKKTMKTTPSIRKRSFVLAKPRDSDTVDAKYKELYVSPRSFLLNFDASERAVCPGMPNSSNAAGRQISRSALWFARSRFALSLVRIIKHDSKSSRLRLAAVDDREFLCGMRVASVFTLGFAESASGWSKHRSLSWTFVESVCDGIGAIKVFGKQLSLSQAHFLCKLTCLPGNSEHTAPASAWGSRTLRQWQKHPFSGFRIKDKYSCF